MVRIVALIVAAIGLIAAAAIVRAPFASPFRPWLALAVAGAGIGAAFLSHRLALAADRRRRRLAQLALALHLCAAAAVLLVEGSFHTDRQRVLAASPSRLEPLSHHLMVGYRDVDEVRRLITLKAVGGVFITRANVVGRTREEIAAEISGFQAIRRSQGMPPLWIATDQEGGIVSRLSPPLSRLPALATLVHGAAEPGGPTVEQLVEIDRYADRHGSELASIGVNLNFAPVVDLDFGIRNPKDAFSRIGERAISRDPEIVAAVVQRYCDGLLRHRVRCTLKHFPGLGRVFEDTHVAVGKVEAGVAELAAKDWLPYRQLAGRDGHFAMVGHVVATAIDTERTASTSKRVVDGYLKPLWGGGRIITDDMCMAPTFKDGIGRAGVLALEAGVDILLVSWDGAQIYPLISALLDAPANLVQHLDVRRRSWTAPPSDFSGPGERK